MFGSHLSIAGGLFNALLSAKQLRMDCVQVFTRNQRQWAVKPLENAEVQQWLAALNAMPWNRNGAAHHARIVSHNSYLINLASPNPVTWKQSVAAMRAELERCEALNIPLCVTHPGAHLGRPRHPKAPNDLTGVMTKDELRGLKRIGKALDTIHRQLPGFRTITCLETTVGSGTNLGYSFHQLAMIRQAVREPGRVGFCLDTCHVTAAGYDMSTPLAAGEVLSHWEEICGLANLRAVHVNDSIGALGSRRDRHAHIGKGLCGRSCFQAVLNHPLLRFVPKILETPKGQDDKGVNLDLVNLRRLRRMVESQNSEVRGRDQRPEISDQASVMRYCKSR